MSAIRDKSQKIAFVYTNLYALYKKGNVTEKSAESSGASSVTSPAQQHLGGLQQSPVTFTTAAVIKAAERSTAQATVQSTVQPFVPKNLGQQEVALASLKTSLEKLNQLHSRLKFMLQEIEDLSKKGTA